jgi:predicted anti-sigma-YlaC factor YlaD
MLKSLTCQQATALLSESLDHRLPLYQRILLRLHLPLCRACQRFQEQFSFLRNLIRQRAKSNSPVAPPALSAEARTRLKRALNSSQQ